MVVGNVQLDMLTLEWQVMPDGWKSHFSIASKSSMTPKAMHHLPATSIGLPNEDVVQATKPLTIFAGYEILELAGRGAMGTVFRAFDPALARYIAIKLPHIDVVGSPRLRNYFMREAKLNASLRHPGLVEVFRYAEVDGTCFIASKWCPGGNLANWMEKHPGPRDPLIVAHFVKDLCEAVAYCHDAGVLHLDIKPGNILLAQEGAGDAPGAPLLADFGLAKFFERSLVETHSSMVLGTPFYMSPEQAEGRRSEIGPCTDVFAIGVVLYELLYDARPFDGETTMQVLDQIRTGTAKNPSSKNSFPKPLRTILEICLQPRPEDRYASAKDLANDLARFLEQLPIMARKPSKWRRLKRWLSQTQRIQQAGVVTIGINASVIGSVVLMGILMLVQGTSSPIQVTINQFLPQFSLIILGVHLPAVVAGIYATKLRWWSVPAMIVFAIGFLSPQLLIAFGAMQTIDIYREYPGAAFIAPLVHGPVSCFQLLACSLAIPAAVRLNRLREIERNGQQNHG